MFDGFMSSALSVHHLTFPVGGSVACNLPLNQSLLGENQSVRSSVSCLSRSYKRHR